ncbi:MAG: phosphoribosyl-ATP diphosphatase [Alphaproteobacteria bacterium]
MSADATVLDRLAATVAARRGADPSTSYTAKLLAGGPAVAAKKLGEEAVETVIEAARGDAARLAEESADLLYHLLVLWAAAGVRPSDVWEALARREGTSGLAEKAGRGKPEDR